MIFDSICFFIVLLFAISTKWKADGSTNPRTNEALSIWAKSLENLYAQEPRMLEPPVQTVPELLLSEFNELNARPVKHKKKKKIRARKQNSLNENSSDKKTTKKREDNARKKKKKKKRKEPKKKKGHEAHWDREVEKHTVNNRNQPVDIIVHIKMKE